MDLLATIVELSHRFGPADYVRGGGGNTSAKDAGTLWVKPSGTTLSQLKPEDFVALDRNKLARLYSTPAPADPQAREALVKDMMAAAVRPAGRGRPSVEAPLHDSLDACFVVHTHPALVNGLTCAKNGRSAAKKLFPQALWIDYTDPGYTLCMKVRRDILDCQKQYGRQPEIILLENHGIFVAADDPDRIGQLHEEVFTVLKTQYRAASVSVEFPEPKSLTQDKLNRAKALFSVVFSPRHSAYGSSFGCRD